MATLGRIPAAHGTTDLRETEGTMADATNDDVTESGVPDDGSGGAISPDEVLAGGSRDEAGSSARPSR